MWSPTTAGALVVGATVGAIVVVVGADVVVVVALVVVGGNVVVGGRVGKATTSVRASCHCETTYDTAPPTTSAVSTRSTTPTLRFARPAYRGIGSRSGSGGSHWCDISHKSYR